MRRALVRLTLTGLLPLAAIGLPLARAAAATPQASSPALSWKTCDGHYRCATLKVPIDYAAPGKGTLSLAVVELASTSAHPSGDLVMNPGGPGGSGVQFIEQTPFPASLRARFNLISFDPRGVNESDPVHCVDAATLRDEIAADPAPTTTAEVKAVVADTKVFVDGCAKNTPHLLLENLSTATTAHDMDRLRAALGVQKLDYMGFSYGTYLGELYAERYPSHIRAMVLDGVFDPALSYSTSDLQQAEGFEGDLQDFFNWCDGNAACHKELPLGARASYDNLFGPLARGATIPALLKPRYGGRLNVTLGTAEEALIGSLYSPQSWPQLAQAIQQGLAGDGGLLAAIAFSFAGLQPNGTYTNEIAAENAIGCLDRPSPSKLSTYEKLSDTFAKAAPDFGASEAWGGLSCAYWPIKAQYAPAPIAAAKSPEILLVGSTGDPATPYEWAKAVSHQLAHARLLTRIGPGHTGYFFSTCIERYVNAYLTSLVLPPIHATCQTTTKP